MGIIDTIKERYAKNVAEMKKAKLVPDIKHARGTFKEFQERAQKSEDRILEGMGIKKRTIQIQPRQQPVIKSKRKQDNIDEYMKKDRFMQGDPFSAKSPILASNPFFGKGRKKSPFL